MAHLSPRWLVLGAGVLMALSSGCGPVQSARAYRTYATEAPSLDVALDRTEDLAASLELVDQLLTRTPVSPDDAWLGHLGLTNDGAQKIRDELRKQPPYSSGDFQIPLLKLYRVHLERVLAEAKSSGAAYPSMLDAVGALGGEGRELKAHWTTFIEKRQGLERAEAAYEAAKREAGGSTERDAVRAADQARQDAKTAAREAESALERDVEAIRQGAGAGDKAALLAAVTTAVSVAYRVELEAAALMPVITVQAVRSIPDAARRGSPPALSRRGVGQLTELPDHLQTIKDDVTRQAHLLELLTVALAAGARVSVAKTAGFALGESVAETVVGLTLDSFHAEAKAGGEAFFFSALKQSEQSSNDVGGGKTINKDLSGRLRTLTYDVKPIVFAAFQFSMGLDYGRLRNALGLDLGYKTDRAWSSGGSIENQGFAQQLGVSGAASDVLNVGLGVFGVKTAVRVARFTSGTVTYADADGNAIAGADGNAITAPLRINFTQVDLGYDLSFLFSESTRSYLEELSVGGRYFRYELPRILYELDVTRPSDDVENQVYKNESAPQTIPSTYYMGGATARFGRGVEPVFSPFGELGFYIGGGPTRYRLRPNKAVACAGSSTPATGQECVDDQSSGSNGPESKASAFAFDLSLSVGARVRLVKPGRRFRLNAEAVLRGELIYANANTSFAGGGTQVDFGSADLFWGPRFNLVGEF